MMRHIKKSAALALALSLVLALTACGGQSASSGGSPSGQAQGTLSDYGPDRPVTVRVGLTGSIYEDIWSPIAQKLAPEGILLELVQFSDFSLPNRALSDGDIEINAFQHHPFLEKSVADNGYHITSIGDTFVIAMNLYSDKISHVSQLKDGDKVALPNDASNAGRALKLLQAAGLLTLDPAAGESPEVKDVQSYQVQLELVEVDAANIFALLPDVAAAAINGNYALDCGLDPQEDGIFFEEDDTYACLIAARTQDANSPALQRIVEVFQSEDTKEIFQTRFNGFFVPVWEE